MSEDHKVIVRKKINSPVVSSDVDQNLISHVEASKEILIDGYLLSNFVHQIINPLNGSIGILDNLIDDTVKDESKKKRQMKELKGQLGHTIEMVRNLAFLGNLETEDGIASLKEKESPVVIPKTILDAAIFFQHNKRGISIRLRDKETQYIVKGYYYLIKQVIINLLDNAVKYADKDSNVEIDIRVQKKTGYLVVEVINVGHGFDNASSAKLFEAGYREDRARMNKASGSGIGLHICKRIIEKICDGKITAEHSESDRITTFRLFFPQYTVGEARFNEHE